MYNNIPQNIGLYNSDFEFNQRKHEVQTEELFLALASITSNEEFFSGEYIFWKVNGDIIYKVYKENNEYYVLWKGKKYFYNNVQNLWRKATKEEIINHFSLESKTKPIKTINTTNITNTTSTVNTNTEKIFPEVWCIACKDNIEVRRYFDKNCNRNCYEGSYNYGYLHRFNNSNYSNYGDITIPGDYRASFHGCSIRPGYTEITFDEFKKYVLKETDKEFNMEKTLIGYILKNNCKQFEKTVLSIMDANDDPLPSGLVLFNGVHLTYNARCVKYLQELNLLDKWFDKVYEVTKIKKKDVVIRVPGSKEISFTISEDYEGYVKENIEQQLIPIKSLSDMIFEGFDLQGYVYHKVKCVTFNIGCIKNIPISGIKEVITAYDSFWGTNFLKLNF